MTNRSDSPKQPFDIKAALANLPDKPGVYRMYGKHGKLLYIGKAKVLKNRVRNYFQKNGGHSPRIKRMITQITHFDYVITANEIEALILEDSLVKTHWPPFNVLLKDDKRYPWLCITDEAFPRIVIARRVPKNRKKSKAKYFGPYINSGKMYQTLKVIRKHFPMRQRRKPLFRDRPCMNYSIGTCPGPCQNLITEADYAKTLEQIQLFLKGKTRELITMIESEMTVASEALNFEWAAKLRDRYAAVEYMANFEQSIHIPDPMLELDAIGMAADQRQVNIIVAKVRGGRVTGSTTHTIELANDTTPEEAYSSFLFLHYQDLDPDEIPNEVLLQFPLQSDKPDEDETLLEEWLSHRRNLISKKQRKVLLSYPQKGIKRELLELAINNAKEAVTNAQLSEASRLKSDPTKALLTLQETLKLPRYPKRIECYDISHFQGAYTVASMVVFIDGQPDKSEYRKFKIKTTEGKPDDFQSMFEVISRRFKHSEKGAEGKARWDKPDLVIIDGGKGQLSHAVEALEKLGVENQPIISLAKKFEEVFIPNHSRPIILPRSSAALFVLQQLRDESHRFAITYHRQLRAKGAHKSALDDIPGLGPKRKARLLDVFGSVEKIKKATFQELQEKGNLPDNVALAVFEKLQTN